MGEVKYTSYVTTTTPLSKGKKKKLLFSLRRGEKMWKEK